MARNRSELQNRVQSVAVSVRAEDLAPEEVADKQKEQMFQHLSQHRITDSM
jgi:hypothetical protein